MDAAGRNKKSLFLSCFQTVVRKKDMGKKPVKKVFAAVASGVGKFKKYKNFKWVLLFPGT